LLIKYAMFMGKVTLLIIDDHNLVAETCAFTLSAIGHVEVVAITGKVEEAISMVQKFQPNVILLDINLNGVSGFDLIRPILDASGTTKIIGYSMHVHPVYAKKMIQLGAKGYLSKNSSIAELSYAIKAVMKNEKYICHEIRERITDEVLGSDNCSKGIFELTDREREILKLLHQGFYSREIAVAFGISIKTVEVHRHNILKKLGVKNTVSAVAHFSNYTNEFPYN